MNRVGAWDLAESPRTESAFVFVIEDDRGIRETLEELLVEAGYRVETSVDAREALDRLEDGAVPDLILLDLMLPAMDGWQFRLEQRARPRLADVPIVVLSADASSKAAAIDADAFVRKPFDFDRLLAVIERLLLANRRHHVEQRTRELERLRALGSLVAGVAHEINNPLTFVSANVELSLRDWGRVEHEAALTPELWRRVRRSLEGALVGAQRIEQVVRALSRFSRAEDERPSPVDLLRPLESATTLAAAQIRSRAVLVQELQELPPVLGSESRLSQVVLNLLVNAAQAIERGRQGENEIRVRTFEAGPLVVVEISDTGSGIPEELQARIFEPFFTTKPAGEGTGLGLALSKEIITEHGGTISVRSESGVGSTFRIELPAMKASAAEAKFH